MRVHRGGGSGLCVECRVECVACLSEGLDSSAAMATCSSAVCRQRQAEYGVMSGARASARDPRSFSRVVRQSRRWEPGDEPLASRSHHGLRALVSGRWPTSGPIVHVLSHSVDQPCALHDCDCNGFQRFVRELVVCMGQARTTGSP